METTATFQALADAMIPSNHQHMAHQHMANDYEQYGALDLRIDQYVIWTLDHYLSLQMGLSNIPIRLSDVTAKMLNDAATQLVAKHMAVNPPNFMAFPGGGAFAALSRIDRIRTLEMLDQLEIDLGSLPAPYQNNANLVINMVDTLNRLVMFGYYSEWSGYGSTSLATPEARRIEWFPIGWIQVGYHGPSFGHRDFRGYLVEFPLHRRK